MNRVRIVVGLVGMVLVSWVGTVLVRMDEGVVDLLCSLHSKSDNKTS